MDILSLNGVMPTQETIKGKEYMLNRELCFVTLTDQMSPDAKQFIEYALSAEGQSIASEMGYIPI